MLNYTLLVIDDEKAQLDALVGFFKKKKYSEEKTTSGDLGLEIVKAFHHKQLVSENRELHKQVERKFRFTKIISVSSEMEEVLNTAAWVAATQATILIRGESGTGKELVAKVIHYSSPRKDMPLITVNCAALPENLLESELFGYEKGAFTGAACQRKGRFELAHNGTLFLDEIGEMPMPNLSEKSQKKSWTGFLSTLIPVM